MKISCIFTFERFQLVCSVRLLIIINPEIVIGEFVNLNVLTVHVGNHFLTIEDVEDMSNGN